MQTDERTIQCLELMVSVRLRDRAKHMGLCILCKRRLISIQTIILYVDPKKYSFFFFHHLERERGNKLKQLLDLFYLYFCIS